MKAVWWGMLLAAIAPLAGAQTVAFDSGGGDDTVLAKAMPALAAQLERVYREPDRDKALNQRFRLQMVAGRYREAIASIRELRALRGPGADTLFLQYELYSQAQLQAAETQAPFEKAFASAFAQGYGRLDDRTAARVQPVFGAHLPRAEDDLRKAVERSRGEKSIALADALELIRLYQFRQVYAAILPALPALLAEDEARRYVVDKDLVVRTPAGVPISVMVVRPKSSAKQATLFGFTVYANDDWSLADAKTAASYGYAGVVGYTRGKGRSDAAIVPYEHDGEDAAAVIDWIARQPWSDGRVGMYGGSYNGFAAWAAAKHRPPALKALMTSATAAPGIDVPMQGNVFLNFLYPWPLYVTNNKSLDDATYNDAERWNRLNREWYRSGRAYRDLDAIDGAPNPIFDAWLRHPGYDAYWQRMIPYGDEFAGIDIPVLVTTGYFDGARVGALYYFQEHIRRNPRADHTLVIGPFQHFSMQAGVAPQVEGYTIDPVARIDLQALRYEWFDHVFKRASKPALLKDRVNYQVMGGNEWKHAPSIEAMANGRLRFYLQAAEEGSEHRLAAEPASGGTVSQRVDFADRSDADWTPSPLSLDDKLDPHGGLVFVSDRIEATTEVEGLFSGHLDFAVNKRDMDIEATLYEKMADGRYFYLSSHLGRASYAQDRSRRHLLKPGKRQQLEFRSERLVSRRLESGSRLVLVLAVPKQPDRQLNMGSGKDASEETAADAGAPLRVRWYGDSYIDVPVWRVPSPSS